ncbi:hypothetical protein L1887_37215 [Cichorium endivia]|nr:hypothetical protein L1887_37215 [Cichorium endivia]
MNQPNIKVNDFDSYEVFSSPFHLLICGFIDTRCCHHDDLHASQASKPLMKVSNLKKTHRDDDGLHTEV